MASDLQYGIGTSARLGDREQRRSGAFHCSRSSSAAGFWPDSKITDRREALGSQASLGNRSSSKSAKDPLDLWLCQEQSGISCFIRHAVASFPRATARVYRTSMLIVAFQPAFMLNLQDTQKAYLRLTVVS